jgi:hypothetical protein
MRHLLDTTEANVDTMGTAEKILPGYSNVVGESREKENPPALSS